MHAFHTTTLSAAVLYQDHDPLNFRHLATTLNLILEPANLKFRVIHEHAGKTAVLSCRKLHVAISANDACMSSDDLHQTIRSHSDKLLTPDLRRKVDEHRRTIEITVGCGPLPHGPLLNDPKAGRLLPLLAQMVVNHLLNMNPGDAVYWGPTDQFMTPRAFLAMINAPTPQTPSGPGNPDMLPPQQVPGATKQPENPNIVYRQATKTASRMQSDPDRDHPSFLRAYLNDGPPQSSSELSGLIKHRFITSKNGPKAAFVVSIATMFVAPIIGTLLLIYNFMGGARLRQTALLAGLSAGVTLISELVRNEGVHTTASMLAKMAETVPL